MLVLAVLSYVMVCLCKLLDQLSGGAIFAWGSKTEQFCETRLVNLTHRTFTVWFNPFRMFLKQCFVDLLLKLNVSLDFAREDWSNVRLHRQQHRTQSIGGDNACVGF